MGIANLVRQSLQWVERRRHPRAESPRLTLRVDGQKYRALDWSLGGCRIAAPAERFQVKQSLAGRLTLEGADERGKFVAEIVRVTGNGEVGLRWLELSPQIFVAMGQMAPGPSA